MIRRRYRYIWEHITSVIFNNDSKINLIRNIYYNKYLNFWINEHSIHIDKEYYRRSYITLLYRQNYNLINISVI